ncbi:MAG: hypothetical protein ACPGWR_00085 [Ardenticatenaceae bacterium]
MSYAPQAMWVPQKKLGMLDEWVAPLRLAGFDSHFGDERKARLRWLRAVAKGKLENTGKAITRQDGPVKDLEIRDCHATHIADLIEWCESGAKASEVVSERPMSDAEKKIYHFFRRHSKRGNKPLTASEIRKKSGNITESRLTAKQVKDTLASLVWRGIVEEVREAKQRKTRYRLAPPIQKEDPKKKHKSNKKES